MNKKYRSLLLLALMPVAAMAADDAKPADKPVDPANGDWSGSGEAGFAASRGNSKSENLNVKLQFKKEDETWKDNFYLTALRSKGEVNTATVDNSTTPPTIVNTSKYELNSNRYEGGASAGFKLDERSYIVGAVRYENDDFSPFQYQAVVSVGYGYTAIKNESDELSLEIGPGYKRYQPIDAIGPDIVDGAPVRHSFASEGEAVGRGLIAYKHAFNSTTSFVDTLLTEAGSDNTFVQNDAGIQVDMNKKLALKIGYQVRHNSDVAPGIKENDQLMTTNLVYNFGAH
jgi:putative salt-induced outer membrane protein